MNLTHSCGCQINLKEIKLKLILPVAGQIFQDIKHAKTGKTGERKMGNKESSVLVWPK